MSLSISNSILNTSGEYATQFAAAADLRLNQYLNFCASSLKSISTYINKKAEITSTLEKVGKAALKVIFAAALIPIALMGGVKTAGEKSYQKGCELKDSISTYFSNLSFSKPKPV